MIGRISGVDNLRGIAALLVVLYHLSQKFYKTEYIFYLGSYGVHIFFVISGFVIIVSLKDSQKGIGNGLRFIAKRMIRLDPPYIVTLLIILIYSFSISLIFYDGMVFKFQLGRILLHLGYLIPLTKDLWYSPVFWTLSVEFQFYLAVTLIYFLPIRGSVEVLLGLLLLLGLLDIFLASEFTESFILHYAMLFLAGVSTSMYYLKRIGLVPWLCLIIVGGVISFFSSNEIVVPIVMLFSILGILFFKIQNPLLEFLAKVSYSLYLIHYTVLHVLFELFDKFLNSYVNRELVVLASLIITLGCSYIFYMAIERPSVVLSKLVGLKKLVVN